MSDYDNSPPRRSNLSPRTVRRKAEKRRLCDQARSRSSSMDSSDGHSNDSDSAQMDISAGPPSPANVGERRRKASSQRSGRSFANPSPTRDAQPHGQPPRRTDAPIRVPTPNETPAQLREYESHITWIPGGPHYPVAIPRFNPGPADERTERDAVSYSFDNSRFPIVVFSMQSFA